MSPRTRAALTGTPPRQADGLYEEPLDSQLSASLVTAQHDFRMGQLEQQQMFAEHTAPVKMEHMQAPSGQLPQWLRWSGQPDLMGMDLGQQGVTDDLPPPQYEETVGIHGGAPGPAAQGRAPLVKPTGSLRRRADPHMKHDLTGILYLLTQSPLIPWLVEVDETDQIKLKLPADGGTRKFVVAVRYGRDSDIVKNHLALAIAEVLAADSSTSSPDRALKWDTLQRDILWKYQKRCGNDSIYSYVEIDSGICDRRIIAQYAAAVESRMDRSMDEVARAIMAKAVPGASVSSDMGMRISVPGLDGRALPMQPSTISARTHTPPMSAGHLPVDSRSQLWCDAPSQNAATSFDMAPMLSYGGPTNGLGLALAEEQRQHMPQPHHQHYHQYHEVQPHGLRQQQPPLVSVHSSNAMFMTGPGYAATETLTPDGIEKGWGGASESTNTHGGGRDDAGGVSGGGCWRCWCWAFVGSHGYAGHSYSRPSARTKPQQTQHWSLRVARKAAASAICVHGWKEGQQRESHQCFDRVGSGPYDE